MGGLNSSIEIIKHWNINRDPSFFFLYSLWSGKNISLRMKLKSRHLNLNAKMEMMVIRFKVWGKMMKISKNMMWRKSLIRGLSALIPL